MGNSYIGAPKQREVKPAFQVKKLEGHRNRFVYNYVVGKNKKGKPSGRIERVEKKVPAGFMVYFPQGHSIRLETEDEVKRLGFDQNADLIDMDTGEAIPTTMPVDLEREASRITGNAPLE